MPSVSARSARRGNRWKVRDRQAVDQLERVAVIELAKYQVRHVEAVELPERVVVAVAVGVLGGGLERAEEGRVLGGLVGVLPEQDAILVLHEERACGARLAPELLDDC